MIARLLIGIVFLALAPLFANAQERITAFDVSIEAQRNGDIEVSEEIAVIAQGYSIQRGIFRDLPRYYEKGGARYPFKYDVKSVTRDGAPEPYAIETDGAAYRIRIGDADVYIDHGQHRYRIVYGVRNQIRHFDAYDELYWNVTGNFWDFGIDRASARIALPGGAGATQTAAYAGPQGATGGAVDYRFTGGAHLFSTRRALGAREGLTVAVGFDKGVVDPPSAGDARSEWWARNSSIAILGAAMLAIALYYLAAWRHVGVDPPKGPVFPRYEPPEGYAPGAVHHVYNRSLSGHDAFIASILSLAVKKRVRIETVGKRTTLTRLSSGNDGALSPEEQTLSSDLFGGASEITFGGKYNPALTAAYERFRKSIGAKYGAPYFRWNYEFLLIAVVLSGAAFIGATKLAVDWTPLHTGFLVALGAMALAASYFLPAPTRRGQDVRTEIEGFRLYLKTAEEMHLNAVKVGDNAPPPMSVERYERFLPYAIALGVEKPWSEHFEKLMPQEAEHYRPYWSNSNFSGRSISSLNNALVAGITSGVASSLPQSSSSSGSGGGGFSGGGGGGGGGGGW